MKKILLFLLPLISFSAAAQGRHELSFFLGGPATEVTLSPSYSFSEKLELYSMYEPRTYSIAGVNFGFDYTYTLLKWLKIGLQADLSAVEFHTYYPQLDNPVYVYRTTPDERSSLWTACIMPEAKFFFLNKRIVKLYGKTAAGVRFALSQVKSSGIAFAYEFVPIGIQLGGQKIYFTSEIPFGTEVTGFRLGLGFRF